MPFDAQPTLEGSSHVKVRPLRPADFEALYAVASDPLIWAQHPVPDRWKGDVFKAFFQESLGSGGALAVIDARGNGIIGSSRFHGYDEHASEVEIGWTFLARPYWGGVYNQDLKRLMLRHAFGTVGRVVFLVGPHNLRSRTALEKIGALCVGARVDGSGRDSLLYEITESSFAAGPFA